MCFKKQQKNIDIKQCFFCYLLCLNWSIFRAAPTLWRLTQKRYSAAFEAKSMPNQILFDLKRISMARAFNQFGRKRNKKKRYSIDNNRHRCCMFSIDIWPARNSRLTQRETNHYITRCASELAAPGPTLLEARPDN